MIQTLLSDSALPEALRRALAEAVEAQDDLRVTFLLLLTGTGREGIPRGLDGERAVDEAT